MEAAVKTFFSSPYFAVVGASQNPAKFGHKVFAWYVAHSLPASPINPTSPAIDLASTSHPTVASVSALPSPEQTSISIITPPAVTIKVLEEAKAAGVPAVWLQPGTFDDKVLNFAKKEFQAAVGGDGGWGSEGWCVLVDGEWGLELAGRNWKKQRI
ncbi:NAD(P)-binding protein [Xylona heveae TC161]|uniref:NAD(P)-binding protein n=1 Tax=Xylona heveae (strain CBS 132557 / TC161) TaxID=1328760 RepID=A0A165IWD8_XYLHT|nr:NAD(P)-binding protein [Xylona heveae TC161]KZF25472.1 NAD(P)-binding protein [Xylona heveae TC161]